jgi:hypothetical protein
MRLALALLMLVAFTLQSYVTQTHIHLGSTAVTAGIVSDTHGGKSNPLDNETTNCLFCQEMLHAGTFVTPAAVALPLPIEYASILRLDLALPLLTGAIPHGWQGRGPPRN